MAVSDLLNDVVVVWQQPVNETLEGPAPQGLVQDPSPRLAHLAGGIGVEQPWLMSRR